MNPMASPVRNITAKWNGSTQISAAIGVVPSARGRPPRRGSRRARSFRLPSLHRIFIPFDFPESVYAVRSAKAVTYQS